MPRPFPPRRSCLYMPGTNSRALNKARTLDADVVIMDLEDAVAPDSKPLAREQVMAAVTQGGYGHREVWIRINALASPWGSDDLSMAIAAQPDGIVLPKVEEADDIQVVNEALRSANLHGSTQLWAMIESPSAVLNIQSIAQQGAMTRLAGLIFGGNDLAKALGIAVSADRLALQQSLSMIVLACRANALTAIDGVFNQINDAEGLEAECVQGKAFGFDGKTAIHPNQLAICNRCFSPSNEELAHAQQIVAAFNQPANANAGVIQVNGQMVERLHFEQAEQLLARQQALAERYA